MAAGTLLWALPAFSQGSNGQIYYASDFAQWTMPAGSGPATGQIVYSNPEICKVSSTGYNFVGPKVGRPLKIHDANPSLIETVIPTQVQINQANCVITAPMAYQHLTYYLESGTAGIQEAIDYIGSNWWGSLVALTPQWTEEGGLTPMITAAYGGNATSIIDERNSCFIAYNWSGSAYTMTANFCNGGGGGGGPLLQTNSVNNLDQTILNLVNGPGITVTNTSGGIDLFACVTTAGVGVKGCPFIPLFGTGTPTASCSAANASQEYYNLDPATTSVSIYICKNTPSGYAWAPLAQVPSPQTIIEVNGSATIPVSPVNFVDTSSIHFSRSGATVTANSQLVIKHNDSTSGINQLDINFDDTTPPAPGGNVNVTFQHDLATGRWSGYVPVTTSNTSIDIQPQGLPVGTHALVYPTGVTLNLSNARNIIGSDGITVVAGDPVPITRVCSNSIWQGVGVCPSGFLLNKQYPSSFPPASATITWTFANAWEGQTPITNVSHITGIQAFVNAGNNGAGIHNIVCGSATMGVAPFSLAYDQNAPTTLVNPDTIVCSASISDSLSNPFNEQVTINLAGLALYYNTDPPPAADTSVQVVSPLTLINNQIGMDPGFPQWHWGMSVASLNNYSYGDYSNGIAIVNDYNSTSIGVCAGGGTNKALATAHYSGGLADSWYCYPFSGGGGGGGVSLTSALGSLTLTPSPITGTGTLDINLAHGNTWTALQAFSAGLNLSGSSAPLQLNGSAGTTGQCPISQGSGATPIWGTCGGGGGSTAWSSLTNPSTNLGLTMGADTSTFTYGASTGANDLFKLTDTLNNTGTGVLLHLTTASGSALTPFEADANGVGWKIDTTGALVGIGSVSIHKLVMPGGTQASGASTAAVITTDATGKLYLSENNATLGEFCTSNNGACSTGGSAIVASAEVVAFSATPTFSTAFNVSRMVLTGNVTSFTMSGASDGQDKTLCFKQGAGPYTVAAPASVHGFSPIGTINAEWSCQTFVWDNTDSIWQATTAGVINQ